MSKIILTFSAPKGERSHPLRPDPLSLKSSLKTTTMSLRPPASSASQGIPPTGPCAAPSMTSLKDPNTAPEKLPTSSRTSSSQKQKGQASDTDASPNTSGSNSASRSAKTPLRPSWFSPGWSSLFGFRLLRFRVWKVSPLLRN